MLHVGDRVGHIQCTFVASECNTQQGSFHWILPPPCVVLAARSLWTPQKRGPLSQQPLLLRGLSSFSTPVLHPSPSTFCVGLRLSPLPLSIPPVSLALAGHPRASCGCSSTGPSEST